MIIDREDQGHSELKKHCAHYLRINCCLNLNEQTQYKFVCAKGEVLQLQTNIVQTIN